MKRSMRRNVGESQSGEEMPSPTMGQSTAWTEEAESVWTWGPACDSSPVLSFL